MRFACLCCGHRTLTAPPGFTDALCEVCAYEDIYHTNGTFLDAQRCYVALGAVDPEYVSIVRPPTPEGAPPVWFAPLDALRSSILEDVFEAFGDQDLAGGVSLEEADLIDDYAMPSRDHTQPPARGFGVSGPWYQVDNATMDAYWWGPFSFMDARGLRFYLPVCIRMWAESTADHWDCPILFTLESGHRLPALQALLTDAQRRVTARFIAAELATPDGLDRDRAIRALRRSGWGEYLSADHLAHLPE